MNTTTVPVVSFVIKPLDPELPKRVWLDPLPNAAPISEPLPVCKSTIRISPIVAIT